MLIAQLTDIHVGFSPEDGGQELNLVRLRSVVDRLLAQPNPIDLLLLTGDLTDKGDPQSFERLVEALAPCPFPVQPLVGNHDLREPLLDAFPQCPQEDGFVHYAIEREGLLILCLDTVETGLHGGAFCSRRAAWLRNQLNAHPDMPTVIFMHHPPVVSGIDWMDPSPDDEWIANFAGAVAGHENVIGIRCGHLHRPIHADFHGIPISVTPPVAPYVAMDFGPSGVQHDHPRALIATEPPGYALHRWDGKSFVSHYETVGDWEIIAHYGDPGGRMTSQDQA